FVQSKKHVSFSEKRRFGGVQIFRRALLVLQQAPAERDDFTNVIADWKHDSVAKPIVRTLGSRCVIFVLCLQQTARDKFACVVPVPLRPILKRVPFVGRVPTLPMFCDLPGDSAALQIFPRWFSNFFFDQIFLEPYRGFSM